MHEYAIVEAMVSDILKQLIAEGVKQVLTVRFRRGSAFSPEALRQAYTMAAAGTPLEDAQVEIETVNLHFSCPCGHRQIVTSDDLVGHMFICPACGAIKEMDEAHDLELIEVVAAETEVVQQRMG